jgi:type IX secretion system PorP/SprF family membrane protein
MRPILITTLLFLFSLAKIWSQDPAYGSFMSGRVLFNPSLVGAMGSQSLHVRTKGQWLQDGGGGYKTISILGEETMPCSVVDMGFKLNFNEEGSGLYRTFEAGLLVSSFIPFSLRRHSDHNIRFGMDASWGRNTINYSKLIFSDQLDPKYGVIGPSSFNANNPSESKSYVNPGLGTSIRSLWNKNSKNALMTNVGVAMYRFYGLRNGELSPSISILGLQTENQVRYSAFAEAEFIPKYLGSQFISLKPFLLYQKQGNFDYLEVGTIAGWSRSSSVSLQYHTSVSDIQGSTRWFSLGTSFMMKINKKKQLNLNLIFSENLGGLRNFVGSQFEIGIVYHIARSSVCNALDKEDDVPYGSTYKCPIMSVSPGKQKMYENIWNKD